MATTLNTAKLIPAALAQQVADQAGIPDVTPLTEARIFNLLRMAGYTNEDISKMTGRRACYVGWRLDLLKLNQATQDALNAGDLPVNLAWYIAQLSEPNQNLMLTRWARGEFTSPYRAERYAESVLRDENSALPA